MASKEEYDVLRLIEHNRTCYVSLENVKGCPLIKWLKYHPGIPKERLCRWAGDIAKQLAQIHKCRGRPYYRYVNPYSIIVTEEEQLYFLDMDAESNAERLKKMQRRVVREHFLPPEESYYQKASAELDIYGFGKTLQYLLSESEPEPCLNRREELKFQRIISRCLDRHSKKTFKQISDIPKYIPEYNPIAEKKSRCLSAIAFLVLAAAATVFLATAVFEDTESSAEKAGANFKKAEENVTEQTRETEENSELYMELGVVNFLEVRNYEKSKEYFQAAGEDRLAEYMAIIAECLAGKNLKKEEMRKALKKAEDSLPEENKELYYRCLLEGYAYLDLQEDIQNTLRIGRICLEAAGSGERAEIRGRLADAYERNGQKGEAVEMYEQQLEEEADKAVREEIIKKIANLLEESGEIDKAQEKLRQGIEEFPESAELKIQYIRIQCRDKSIDRRLCVQTIEDCVKELPSLQKEEEFQKLMREYGINVEGEKVWAEK